MKRAIMAGFVLIGVLAGVLVVQANSTTDAVMLENHGRRYTVRVELNQATTGQVQADIRVRPAAEAVALFAVMPDMGHSTPELIARQRSNRRFHASGELFTMAGAWQLGVRVQGDPSTELVTFNVLVGEG